MRRLLALAPAVVLVLAGCADDVDQPLVGEPVPDEPGMRYVGASGVVIAIPDSWSLDDSGCPATTRPDTYIVRDGQPPTLSQEDYAAFVESECQPEDGGLPVPSLSISPSSSYTVLRMQGDPAPPPLEFLDRDGLQVNHQVACDEHSCRAGWLVDGPEASFGIEVPREGGRAAIAAMDESLRLLPPGWTTSPEDGTVVPAS